MKLRPAIRQFSCAGFTLVELLVSLAIVGLISTMALGALTTGGRVWGASDRVTSERTQTTAIQRIMKDQISNLLPIKGRYARLQDSLLIDGDPRSFRFVAPLPAYIGEFGLYRIEYALSGDRLVFSRSLYQRPRDFDLASEYIERKVLLDDLDDIRFSYLRQDAGLRGWASSLSDATEPPTLVRLEIERDGVWKTLVIVSPKLTAAY